MAIKLSTKCRNNLLDSSSIKTMFNAAEIRIFSGTEPADADAAQTGTLLATIKEGGSALTFGSASGGVLSKSANSWSDTVDATGTASYYRLVQSADAGGATGSSDPRIQGTIGTAGADMNLSSVSLTSGGTQTIDFFSLTMPSY